MDHAREAGERVVRQLGVQERIERVTRRDDQDRVAVRRRTGDDLAADDAAGARAHVDHQLLSPMLAHFLAEQPCEHVVAAAGG